MIYVVGFLVLALLIYAIAKAASGSDYENMTEGEFEQEARRSSRMAAAITGLQKIIDPAHRVEYVQQENQKSTADAAQSGDPPDTTPSNGEQRS